jgi:hypothetical protein
VLEYLRTGLVPRFPTAILVSAMMIIATVTAVLGYVLDALAHSRQESARLAYLRFPAPGAPTIRRVPGAAPAERVGSTEVKAIT